MHASAVTWCAAQVIRWDLSRRSVLEVGSLNVNGSVRALFTGDYLGVDRQWGEGVDKIMDGEALGLDDDSYDVVISTEALEHVERPWLFLSEMERVCKPEGFVLVTCRGYDERGCFPVHGYPDDIWRFSARALWTMALDAGLNVRSVDTDTQAPGFFLLAMKLPAAAAALRAASLPRPVALRGGLRTGRRGVRAR
jgi:SAM-dependent methyltransferase